MVESMFLASPSFDGALRAWLEDSGGSRAHHVPETLLRYVIRMCARPTPFGLFAGCSLGRLAETTTLELGARHDYTKRTRFDMHYLAELAEHLERDPAASAPRLSAELDPVRERGPNSLRRGALRPRDEGAAQRSRLRGRSAPARGGAPSVHRAARRAMSSRAPSCVGAGRRRRRPRLHRHAHRQPGARLRPLAQRHG